MTSHVEVDTAPARARGVDDFDLVVGDRLDGRPCRLDPCERDTAGPDSHGKPAHRLCAEVEQEQVLYLRLVQELGEDVDNKVLRGGRGDLNLYLRCWPVRSLSEGGHGLEHPCGQLSYERRQSGGTRLHPRVGGMGQDPVRQRRP